LRFLLVGAATLALEVMTVVTARTPEAPATVL
jgi:hypothetical protein